MRWISRLLRRRPEPTPQRPESPGQKAAEKALTRARLARRELEAQRSAVSQVASRLARERDRNHFAEMFREAFGGRAS